LLLHSLVSRGQSREMKTFCVSLVSRIGLFPGPVFAVGLDTGKLILTFWENKKHII
jgi:hypothetical protein